jgi:hypothetical protein
MKGFGKTINSMEKELKYGKKDPNMKEIIIWGKSRE